MMRRWRQRRLWTRMNQQIDGTKFLADAALLPPGSIIETPIAAIFGKLELTTRAADVERINNEVLFLAHPSMEPRDLEADRLETPSTPGNNLLGNVELQIMNVEWIDHGAVPRDLEGNRLEAALFDLNQELSAVLATLEEMNR